MTLDEMLATMDLPAERRDISKPENVRWLLRNIGVRNVEHEHFYAAFEQLLILQKEIKRQHGR